ncbi:MAG TPA: hypothetical protein VMU36_00640 [Spirochaetia bacterium]|nr:hypothetical protein [Spirochaetia bacterium]
MKNSIDIRSTEENARLAICRRREAGRGADFAWREEPGVRGLTPGSMVVDSFI